MLLAGNHLSYMILIAIPTAYHHMSELTAGCLQVFLTNGRLQMYRNKEVVHSGEVGDGVCFVINGIVKVACIDLKDTQDYFLGSGDSPCLIRHQCCMSQHALVGRWHTSVRRVDVACLMD